MYMHGKVKKEGENRLPPRKIIFGQHMQSVPSPKATRTSVEGNGNTLIVDAATDSPASFSKDRRKISVGDCALFKPPHDSPPFIGVICSLAFSEEKNLQLGVTWLYRPAEVKLGKGILLEAAPNEIFYSFHKDEIPAASLLHPCKVAFLPKGVELPQGISSFVCRRVYDIDNKCLWWLTDQDYIDERQEEVNKLLNRTQKEMGSVVQAGGCSPSVTSAASHLKSASDNLQNSATSSPCQLKGKKRERGEQSYDPVKREHPSKTDDGDSGSVRAGNLLRLEIAKIAEKGGLIDSELVEKLVELIRPRMDKKLDLATRSMVSGVIAATDRSDCLSQFVQLKGLSVLDEWLQDVHKGRIGDSSGSRDGDRSVEEFLLILLRALDKLPVNLHALQTCNIGKSVNHLRSHKNMEIQKKARSLVDTWKKRVEAEMNVIDTRSASPQAAAWPSRPRLPEVHGGRTFGGSCDVALKSPSTQPAESKTASTKAPPVEATAKSACSSPGPIKSASSTASGKEVKPRTEPNNVADLPSSSHEDKNSNSASPHVLVKEDTRFPVAGTMNINKIPSGGSRYRKLNNGFTETIDPGSQKETVLSRSSSVHENAAHEKFPQSTIMGEKNSTVPLAESSNHRLIVKIPNRSRSAAQSPCGGTGDASVMSGRASPVLSYKCESDHDSNNCETYQANVPSHVNIESLHDNDHKDLQAVSDVGDKSSVAVHDEDLSKNVDEKRKNSECSKTPFLLLEKDLNVKKLCEASSCAMVALIESCAKYSKESECTSPGDDVGMNLLASVATREICSSEFVPNAGSLQRNAPPDEGDSIGDSSMSKPHHADNLPVDGCLSDAATIVETEKVLSHTSEEAGRGLEVSKQTSEERRICFAEVCHVPDTKADENGSLSAAVKMGKVVPSADYSKNVERSSSSLSDEIDCKILVDKSLNSNSNLESKPAITANDEISQPTVSSKDDVCGTLDGANAGQDDNKCMDGKLVLESGVPSQDAEGDEKLKVSMLSVAEAAKMEKKDSLAVDDAPLSVAGPLEMDLKMDFDLNEVLLGDDGKCEEPLNMGKSGGSGILKANPLSTPVSGDLSSTPASITVTAAAKAHFVPPVDLLRTKGELGWKGSAATSAFRLADVSPRDDSTCKLYRRPFAIDLNVADEEISEDVTFPDNSGNEVNGSSPSRSGGLDLDLNRVDDANFMMQYPASSGLRLGASPLHFKSLLPSSLPANEVKRDFDLNNGPGFDDGVAEQSSLNLLGGGSMLSVHSLLPASGLRPSSLEIGNLPTCFPHANLYAPVTMSSALPDRGEHSIPIVTPQRILGPSGGNPFMPDMYRGALLSSSPVVPFPSGPFQYQMFPFGTTLPLSSGTFSVGSAPYLDPASAGRLSTPTVNSQFLGPVSTVSSQYPKPYMIGLPDGSSNVGMESSGRKWSRTGLDLNAGPGVLDVECSDDFMRQRQLLSLHAFSEEQGRLCPITGGDLKRKEPEGGLDRESFRYKQPSWQ